MSDQLIIPGFTRTTPLDTFDPYTNVPGFAEAEYHATKGSYVDDEPATYPDGTRMKKTQDVFCPVCDRQIYPIHCCDCEAQQCYGPEDEKWNAMDDGWTLTNYNGDTAEMTE